MNEAPFAQPVVGNAARILVVDDEATTCTFCALALNQAGYSAIPITDPELGLRTLVEQGPFDLLLTDIQMPGRSGIELAQLAREHDPALAVIIMTGHTNVDTLHQSARQGVANFLSKPFEIEELRLAVGQALHKRDLMQEQVRLRALEQLLLSSESINSSLDRATLCRVILECAQTLIPSSAVFLYLNAVDRAPQVLQADPPSAELSTLGTQIVTEAGAVSRPVFIERQEIATLDGHSLNDGIVAPLRAGGMLLGALLFCAGKRLRRADTIELIALLANQAAPALRNAHLYGELERTYHELADLDRMKSEFIAIASHELRSPLALVIGYTQMIRDRNEGESREYARRALEGAEKITQIVDDLTKLRDHDVQHSEVKREPVAIAALVRQTLERFSDEAAGRGHTVTLQTPAEDLTIAVNRDSFSLMVSNLLSNAINFSEPNGTITIRLTVWSRNTLLQSIQAAAINPSLRRMPEATSEHWAVVEISDSGIGIAREHQSRIFERFYQVAHSLTRAHGGTGLGLALVAEAMLQHQGFVWMQANQPQGSCFRLAFPITVAATGL